MTDQIKVSEVSAILRQQLEGISTGIRTEEVGTVLQVSDGVARIYGLDNAEANELLQFDNGMEAIVMNLEEDNVGAVLLGPTDQVKEGDIVKRTGRIASINVSEGMIGRVIDPLGNPIDGKGEITGEACEMPLERKAPGYLPPARQRTVTDRYQGCRCNDPNRTRTARTDHRRPPDRKDLHCHRHDHQPAWQLRSR